MQYVQYYATSSSTNEFLAGATVSVETTSGGLAPLYEQTGATTANPFLSGNSGLYGFAAANGDYNIIVAGQAPLKVYLVDPADIVADSDAAAAAAGAAAALAAIGSATAGNASSVGERTAAEVNDDLDSVLSNVASLGGLLTEAQDGVTVAQADATAANAQATGALADIATADANLAAEISARTTGDIVNAASIASVSSTASANTSAITIEAETRASAIDTIADEVATLTSTSGGLTSSLSIEEATRAAADAAQAAEITTLTSSYGALSASVATQYSTLTTGQAATSSAVTTLQSQTSNTWPNKLINGDFSNGLVGWSPLAGTVVTANDPQVGTLAVATVLGSGGYAGIYQDVPASTGDNFVLGAEGDLSTGAGNYFQLQIVNAGKTADVAATPGLTTLTGWGQREWTAALPVPSGGSYARAVVIWYTANAGGVSRIGLNGGGAQQNFTDDSTKANTIATISNEEVTRASADAALASEITTLTTSVAGNTVAISTEETARVDGDGSLAAQINTLTSDYNTLSASYSSEVTTLSTGQAATASSLTTLESQTNTQPNLVPGLEAGLTAWNVTSGVASSFGLWGTVLDYATATAVGGGIALASTPLFSAQVGATYTAACDLAYFGTAGDYAYANFQWFNSSGGLLPDGPATAGCLASTDFSDTNPRSTYSVTEACPTGAAQGLLRWVVVSTHGPVTYAGLRLVKIERGSVATAYTTEQSVQAVNAAISTEAVTRAAGDAALSSEQTTLSASIAGVSATVTTTESAIVTLQGKTAASLVQGVNAGTGNATVTLASDGVTGIIELVAQILSLANTGGNPIPALLVESGIVYIANALKIGGDITLDPVIGGLVIDTGAVKLILAEPFGASSLMLLWAGPSSVATSACSAGNAYVYISTAGVIDGSGFPGASGGTLVSAVGPSTTVGTAGWTTMESVTFSAIPAGSYWTNAGGFFQNTDIGSNPLSSGSTTTVNWRIVEAPHGTTSYSTIINGAFNGTYNSGEGMYFPESSGSDIVDFLMSGPPKPCQNAGQVDVLLQAELTSPSSMTSNVGMVNATWGRGG